MAKMARSTGIWTFLQSRLASNHHCDRQVLVNDTFPECIGELLAAIP